MREVWIDQLGQVTDEPKYKGHGDDRALIPTEAEAAECRELAEHMDEIAIDGVRSTYVGQGRAARIAAILREVAGDD